MPDKTLTCRDCGREFVFSASEQEFYAQKGFMNEPSRCPECRSARKARTGVTASSGVSRQQREMFPAVCSRCGKETMVPFQPRTDRPVYCSDCFALERGAAPRRPSASRW
jgi:CxxC-x17-CxxC domain-containing protein